MSTLGKAGNFMMLLVLVKKIRLTVVRVSYGEVFEEKSAGSHDGGIETLCGIVPRKIYNRNEF